MARLDQEKQERLEPLRIHKAKEEIIKKGLVVFYEDDTKIKFIYLGSVVTYYPYSGWATGKSIKDGRGLNNLLNQLNQSL